MGGWGGGEYYQTKLGNNAGNTCHVAYNVMVCPSPKPTPPKRQLQPHQQQSNLAHWALSRLHSVLLTLPQWLTRRKSGKMLSIGETAGPQGPMWQGKRSSMAGRKYPAIHLLKFPRTRQTRWEMGKASCTRGRELSDRGNADAVENGEPV